MKNTFFILFLIITHFLSAQTATKEQVISDLPELIVTEGVNLHIISPEPIQYVDLSTQKLTGDLPNTNIARIKISDKNNSEEKEEEEELTGEELAEMDFEELEDVCDDKDLETDPDDYDEDDIEKLRKAIAKELGLKLPAKKEAKGKGKKGKK